MPEDTLTAARRQLRHLAEEIPEGDGQLGVETLLEVLRSTATLKRLAGELEESLVGVLRRLDTSWVEVAAALGISRQTAWERHRSAEASTGPAEDALLTSMSESTVAATPDLEVGTVYTRAQLSRMYSILDATLKNGVFINRDRREIWLFVTEDKTPDRTQYEDRLDGDTLHWQGQTKGRSDQRIVGHAADGYRLMVFHRQSKREHPGAGFRFEGEFVYLGHEPGGPPTNFTLKRVM